jgi:hypothetical protein
VRTCRLLALTLLLVSLPASATAGVLHLTWVDNAANEAGFIVERSLGATFTELARVGPDATLYNDATAVDGEQYCYQVRAFNASGVSSASNPACGTASAAPALPQLTLDLSIQGPTMILTATLTPGTVPALVDAYIVLQGPDGALYSVVGLNTVVPGVVAIARHFTPVPFFGEILRHTATGGEPAGRYTWFAALTEAGTVTVLGNLAHVPFGW